MNEDSNDEHQHNTVRLRCPPVNFGRNRSMEDMIRSNTHEEQQHRSSSFADERQQKLSLQQEQKMKRSSDSALLDFTDTTSESTEPYRQIKREPSHTQQHRSLNDVTNKTPYKGKVVSLFILYTFTLTNKKKTTTYYSILYLIFSN